MPITNPKTKNSLATIVMIAAAASPTYAMPQGKDAGPAKDTSGFTRDCDLASLLASRNYKNQAEWLVKRLRATPNITNEQKASLAFVEAGIAIAAFDNERSYDAAKALYDKAKTSIAEYLKQSPSGQFADRARYEGGDLDRKLGEKIIAQIKVETSAEKIAELRKSGETAFQAANDYFRNQAEKAKAKAQENGQAVGESQEYLAAAYAIPNNYLTWANLYPNADPKRSDFLKRACENFDDFLLSVSDEIVLYFEAYVKYGNARRELGRDDADECYQQAFQLLYGQDSNGTKFVHEPNELIDSDRQIILNAAAEMAKSWNQKQKYEEILNAYNDAKKGIPDLNRFERGAEFILEVARTYEAQGKKPLAKAEAAKVRNVAIPGTPLFNAATEMLQRLGESFRVDDLSGMQVMGQTMGFLREQKYPEAIRSFHAMRDQIRGTPAEAKYMPELTVRGAQAYAASGRPLEAMLLFELVGERYTDNKEFAPPALLQVAVEACTLWRNTKDGWFENVAQDAVDKLQSVYPEHEFAQQAQELLLNTQSVASGKPAIEMAKLSEEQLKGVKKEDPKYGRYSYQAGKRFYDAGKSAKKGERDIARQGAEKNWTLYLDWAKAQNTLDQAEKNKNDERVAFVLLSISQMWLWEPGANVEKTFATLQQLEEMVTKLPALKGKALEIDQVRVRAYVQQGALDKAIAIADGMITKDPTSSRTIASIKKIADVTWDEIRKGFDKMSPERAAQLIDTSVRFNRDWINYGSKLQGLIDPKDYGEAASRLASLGLKRNGVLQWPGTPYLIDQSKFAFPEATQLSAEFFKKALTDYSGGNPAFVSNLRYRRGAALGILQRWKELVEEYQQIVADDNLIQKEPGGEVSKLAPAPAERNYRSDRVMADLAYGLAELARKGDRKAGDEAKEYASLVMVATEPKGTSEPPFEFWFARYIRVLAADANGDRKDVTDRINYYLSTDKELDNDKYGFRKKILALHEKNK